MKKDARHKAIIAGRLALPESDGASLTRTSAAILLRSLAEQMQRSHEFDRPLPPWPESAPPAVEWHEYAVGRKK